MQQETSFKSVREEIQHQFDFTKECSISLPHVTVYPPTMEAVECNSDFRELVCQAIEETEKKYDSTDYNSVSGEHWLTIIPESLRSTEKDIVLYLGMVVAIDFRHWAELKELEEGVGVQPYKVVDTLEPFYCTSLCDAATKADVQHSEKKDERLDAPETVLLRGSAAMMYLLRRAAEEDGIRWYDVDYLCSFTSAADAMTELQRCFVGCRRDGCTPMAMPGTAERIDLLLSIAKSMKENRINYYDILLQSNGRIFDEEKGMGFVNQLVSLHSRYRDFAQLDIGSGEEKQIFPILKLSQLTALGVSAALRAFWSRTGGKEEPISACALPEWFSRQRNAIKNGVCHYIFEDEEKISLCCDYQIPKALRCIGLLRYDEHLEDLVDRGVLLPPNGVEEVSIRVGTLVAGEMLLHFIEQHRSALSELAGVSYCPSHRTTCLELDYSLWLMGRQCYSALHHLCRTVMY